MYTDPSGRVIRNRTEGIGHLGYVLIEDIRAPRTGSRRLQPKHIQMLHIILSIRLPIAIHRIQLSDYHLFSEYYVNTTLSPYNRYFVYEYLTPELLSRFQGRKLIPACRDTTQSSLKDRQKDCMQPPCQWSPQVVLCPRVTGGCHPPGVRHT